MKKQPDIDNDGYIIINGMYSINEIDRIISVINNTDKSSPSFRKTDDLYAIRQLFKYVPDVVPLIFTDQLKVFLIQLFGNKNFVTKSIYFDKPEQSNWFVSYHQDLTISVDSKRDIQGYSNWTLKHNQYAVQPPLSVLENCFTVRIHLDDTTADNGALKVIPASHDKGIYRPETIDWQKEEEAICEVLSGGIMMMRPLLLHSSGRTVNGKRRRVIHIEFCNQELPDAVQWAERLKF